MHRHLLGALAITGTLGMAQSAIAPLSDEQVRQALDQGYTTKRDIAVRRAIGGGGKGMYVMLFRGPFGRIVKLAADAAKGGRSQPPLSDISDWMRSAMLEIEVQPSSSLLDDPLRVVVKPADDARPEAVIEADRNQQFTIDWSPSNTSAVLRQRTTSVRSYFSADTLPVGDVDVGVVVNGLTGFLVQRRTIVVRYGRISATDRARIR